MAFSRILLPTDFSEFSLAACPPAIELARAFDGRIDLLFVLEDLPPVPIATFEHLPFGTTERFYEESRGRAAETMEETVLARIPEAVRGESHILRGPAAHTIVQAARDFGTDLIVVSTHGRSGLKNALLGSVTERIVRTAPCPVLTVRGE
ncbi:MAG: universal stress protein [Planctomycetota bacterium]|jgi:nucleotide-binding universal stress UspA family protein